MYSNVDQSLSDLKTWCTKELIYLGLEHQRPWRRQYRWLSPQHCSYLRLLMFPSVNKKSEKMIQFNVCRQRNHHTCVLWSDRKSSACGSGRMLRASTAHCKGWTGPCYKCTDSYKHAPLWAYDTGTSHKAQHAFLCSGKPWEWPLGSHQAGQSQQPESMCFPAAPPLLWVLTLWYGPVT